MRHRPGPADRGGSGPLPEPPRIGEGPSKRASINTRQLDDSVARTCHTVARICHAVAPPAPTGGAPSPPALRRGGSCPSRRPPSTRTTGPRPERSWSRWWPRTASSASRPRTVWMGARSVVRTICMPLAALGLIRNGGHDYRNRTWASASGAGTSCWHRTPPEPVGPGG